MALHSYKLVQPYFRKNRYLIAGGIFCLLTVDLLQLLIPRVIKWTVDDLTGLGIDTSTLLRYAAYVIVAALGIGIFRYFWRRLLIGNAREIEEGLRNTLFAHIQTLSASYYDTAKTGDIMAHATNDLSHIRMAVGMGIVALTDAVFLGTAAIGFMAYINVRLTLFAMLPMPLIVISSRFFGKRMLRSYKDVQKSFADMTETVRERLAGIRVLKAYNLEADADRRVGRMSRDYIKKNMSLAKVTGSFYPLMILFTNLSLTIVLFLGGRQTVTANITSGDFVAFISYLNLMTWPMMALGWVTNLLQRGAASLDRVNVILQTPPEIVDPPPETTLSGPLRGEIVLEDVSFSYSEDTPRVLKNIALTIPKGSTLGIVGPPGSGKTSLLSLLPRVYDPTSGRLTVDGMPAKDHRLTNLRGGIAFVAQEPFLFSGTIRNNITLTTTVDDVSALDNALRFAVLSQTIQSLPDGLDTIVGEKGIILSGGQKQRVALARAIYLNAPLLALDDPVSQVDVETGNTIINNLRRLAGAKTIVIVSHRLSALRYADKIVVLEDGEITASGPHDRLMASANYYASTYRLQQLEEAYHGTT
jgi:ATP-binding cassette subfamily B multidrug efflux pump